MIACPFVSMRSVWPEAGECSAAQTLALGVRSISPNRAHSGWLCPGTSLKTAEVRIGFLCIAASLRQLGCRCSGWCPARPRHHNEYADIGLQVQGR